MELGLLGKIIGKLLDGDGDVGDVGGLQEAHDLDDEAVGQILVGADEGFNFRRPLQILHTSAHLAHGGTGIRLNHSRRQGGYTPFRKKRADLCD